MEVVLLLGTNCIVAAAATATATNTLAIAAAAVNTIAVKEGIVL